MDLEFIEKDYGWREAKLTVNADFNVHLEINPEKSGRVIVGVSTVADGKPVVVYSGIVSEVFDKDFDAIVYPKYLTIKIDVPVLRGVVTEAT